jgi:beta-fructofuranosidase
VGSGFDKVGGAVLLYTSHDGRNWTYLHPLAQGKWNEGTKVNPVDTGEMWECPDFFPLADKHVLLYSTERKVYWEVGTFDKRDLRFHTETRGLLDHGSYYAMKSMVDEQGRRILWGWVQETRTPAECKAAGWAGAMALPRVLSLGRDNTLRMDIPPEFASLRTATQRSMKGRAGEILCKFKVGQSDCGIELRSGTQSLFSVRYEGAHSVTIGGNAVPLSPDRDGLASVHLFIDGSVIETFVNSKEAMTARCYTPSAADIQVVWTGAPDLLSSLEVWSITPISKDRLTG